MKKFKELHEEELLLAPKRMIHVKLNESFDISKTDFGTNYPKLNNKKFSDGETYFNIGEQIIKVSLIKTDVDSIYFKFSTSRTNGSLDDNNFKAGDDYNYQNANALTIFNKAIYVLFYYLDDNPTIEKLFFEGTTKSLKKVYYALTKNKKVLQKFKLYRWVYVNTKNDVHMFKKIQ